MRTLKEREEISELAYEILDCLADDHENLEQIEKIMADKDLCYSEAELREELKRLIGASYVRCYEPVGYKLQRVSQPDFRKLSRYWFELTPKGELQRSASRSRS
ncbi:MAG: hypothetical protein NZO41_04105 [Candidatus Bipolaricaulota bacterium]|nr:hypothetical protein [Candidatus Bipolaricaulota bacterium]MDW8141468.1 hypothetical protein [Candidatus Bipolaricaulota bacterium]